jgi:hypothetical protein
MTHLTSFSNEVIPSLPTISGSGIFNVNEAVPTIDANSQTGTGYFSPAPNNPSTSYSYPLMDPANLIGTPSTPYMNVALPAYISTLYNNVYKINTNLTNDISEAAVNDRQYPTSYAVQQYVQSQIAGTQIINGSNNTLYVNTTMSNTIIQTAVSAAQGFSYAEGDKINNISIYWMIETNNLPRNGATKTVMFSACGYLTNMNGSPSGNLAFLYAGDDSYFVHLGQQYKYYQFVIRGDFLDFVQTINYDGTSSTSNPNISSWDWIVKDSMGVFSNSVNVSNSSGQSISISKVSPWDGPVPATGLNLTS